MFGNHHRVIPYAPAAAMFAAAVFVSAFIPACKEQEARRADRPGGPPAAAVSVTLGPVNVRPVQRTVKVVGTLWGDEDATVSNKVPGKVIAVYKDIGDRVEAGEVLAQLLKNDYQLTLNQRNSALAEVLARLGVDRVPPEDFDVSALPAVRRARLTAENARAKFERGKQLHVQQPPLLADQDFADLQAAFEVAQSGYEAELLTARALVTEALTRQADVAIAQQALNDTTIRAPRPNAAGPGSAASAWADDTSASAPSTSSAGSGLSFVVSERYVSVGELLPGISRMFRVVDDDPLKFRAAVPERFVGDIRIGQQVDVTVEAYPDTFPGTVSRINPQIDPANRTFQLEIIVPNDQHKLRPGGFARGRVRTRVQEGAVFVRQESVVTFAGVNKVFTVKEGKAAEIGVELGERDGNEVEVVKGLKPGDQVVVGGASKLATGVPVEVRADATASSPAGTTAPARPTTSAVTGPPFQLQPTR